MTILGKMFKICWRAWQMRLDFHYSVSSTYRSNLLHSMTKIDLDTVEKNIVLRRHKNNVPLIRFLLQKLDNDSDDPETLFRLNNELKTLPNATHPRILTYGSKPQELVHFNPHISLNGKSEFSDICKRMNLYRMEHLGNYTGHKSYYLMNSLSALEQALVQYALSALKKNNFQLISVPDILTSSVIEGCGMPTNGDRTQVYKLDSGKCLSGTSEMALAGLFANKIFDETELPIRVAAVSRCYRAETSGLYEEKGIYRVHQFTKVEMFAVCLEAHSETLLESLKDLEVSIFKNLEVNFRLLDMPPSELGAPAYQKYDIEAWMPGRKMWGEISSCSNCTDYQAKRLQIRYRTNENKLKYANTVNGTAVAIPRLLIALVETNQVTDDIISIPNALRSFLRKVEVKKDKRMPEIKLKKIII